MKKLDWFTDLNGLSTVEKFQVYKSYYIGHYN